MKFRLSERIGEDGYAAATGRARQRPDERQSTIRSGDKTLEKSGTGAKPYPIKTLLLLRSVKSYSSVEQLTPGSLNARGASLFKLKTENFPVLRGS